MRPIVIACLAAAFVAVAACAMPTATDETETSSDALRSPDTEEAAFLKLINDYRTSQGLGVLVATPLLNQVAYDHSLDMGTNKYFDHNDLAGHSPFDRMKSAGYNGGWMAENIAAGNDTAAATFDQWKNSAGHNANMLGTHYKAIGIGRAYVAGSPYRWYWTTDFGDVIDSSVNAGADAGTPDSSAADASDASAPIEASAPDAVADTGPVTPPGCASTEAEPNGDYNAPNALGAGVCGKLDPAGEQDWFGWSVASAGVAYDVRLVATGDARIDMWKLVNGGYSRVTGDTSTQITKTSSGAGSYVVLVSSPSNRAQSYTLTLAR